jgi:hypothetical protein
MKTISMTVCAALLVAAPLSAFAAQFAGGQAYTLSKGQTVDENLYAAGGNVVIAGDARADVAVAGGTVLLTGTVGQDLLAGGGTLEVLGSVNGDVRIAGGNVTIGGSVGGDVVVAGGSVHLISGANVRGGVYAAGGQVLVDGTIQGPVQVVGGQITVNGIVAKDVWIKADHVVIGDAASLGGALSYESPNEALIAPSAKIAGAVHYQQITAQSHNPQDIRKGFAALFAAWWFVKFCVMLATAFIAYWLFRGSLESAVRRTVSGFGMDVVRGFVMLVVVPVAVIVSFFTVLGAFLGILALALYILILLASCIYAIALCGSVTHKLVFRADAYRVTWWNILIGAVVLGIVGFIPLIGWLIGAAFYLASIGTLWRLFYGLRPARG